MTDEPGDELLGIGTIELDEAGVASIDEPDPIDGSDDTPLEDATVELSKEEASAVLDFAIVKSEVDGMTLKLVDDADVIVLEAVDSCGSLLLQSVDRVDSLTVLESTFAEICIEGDDLESVELDDARPAEGEEVLEWSLTEVDDASFNTTSVSLVLDCRDVDLEVHSNALEVAEADTPVEDIWFDGVVRVFGWNSIVRVALVASEALMTGAPPWALTCSGYLWGTPMIKISNGYAMALSTLFNSIEDTTGDTVSYGFMNRAKAITNCVTC
jgi:hypothetical protein